MPLTKLEADKAIPRDDGKPLKLSDGYGLSLWVMANGAKYWRLKYRFDGKEKLLALGVYPETTLKDARQKRDEARRLLANDIDPGEKKKADKRARIVAAQNSFEAVAREWHGVKAAEWTPRHAEAVLMTLQRYLFPKLGNRPISEIEAHELLLVLRQVEQTGKLDTAKRLRERCNAIFRLAISTGRARFNPASSLVDALQTPVSKPRPALRQNELPAFLLALDSTETITLQTKLLFQILMICFTRIGETVRAEWDHIDFENALWTIPPDNRKLKRKLKATANSHVVPLPRQALEVFRQLMNYRDTNPYVFPGFRRPGTHMSEATPLKALERMGYGGKNTDNGHVVTHGFRATASTILNESGFNPDAVERQLSHTEPNLVRAAYNRAQYMEERRHMLQCWADYLDEIRSNGAATNIALLSKR